MRALFLRYLLTLIVFVMLAGSLTAQTNGPVVIPVVFHVLHLGGSEDISDAQVLNAINILNRDYNRLNIDTTQVIPPYQNNVANMQITFRLANLDPSGNCTNGIEHIYSCQTNVGTPPYAPGHEWPRNKYLNIWVYGEMRSGGEAYTYAPWNADTLPAADGIDIANNYVGSIGTGSPLTSLALTHETGGYFGLLNLFGSFGDCFDDSVADTPPLPLIVPSSSCDTVLLSCDSILYDNFQNFMAYSICSSMFTNGQRARVYTYLNRAAAQRNNLWIPANLLATGTNDTTPTPCAPIANFCPLKRYTCLGDAVTFEDVSYNGAISNRLWNFQHANITTDTAKLVSVTFDTTGWQTVTLEVLNAEGNSSITKTMLYVAADTAIYTAPYFTSFEDTALVSQTWASIFYDSGAPYFRPVSNAAHSGNSSILLNNFNSEVNWNEDDLISPGFDCSALADSNSQISFWYAYATRGPDLNAELLDSLSVSASTNCGQTWTTLYHASGSGLINSGVESDFFIPGSANDWQQKIIPLPSNLRTGDVIFKFSVFGAANSNNLYIDDFNMGNAPTGINDLNENTLTVFPNPFSATVLIRGLQPGEYSLSVSEVTGRTMLCSPDIHPDKNGDAVIDLSSITASGVYFLRVSGNTTSSVLKLVKR